MTLRVANCSGFYGDRLSAAREMVEGGPIDVLTGDWLAELTMLILAGNRLKGRPGYAPTFLRQLEDVLGPCLDRGIKIVANAGGLDPAGCAEAVHELAARLGLSPAVAHVTGDDLIGSDLDLVNADTGERLDATPLTANAYLGGRPIAAALSAGADVVVTGRVTDAALVTGPGIWRYGWGPGDLDPLAGSVVAGHIIECGCQATGGNYAFFQDVPDLAHCGFPIAELRADGSAVITKHPGTGGLVSIGTVTAQLVYELGGPRYLGPDVVARFDTITLSDDGPDRVQVSGVRGEPPPDTLKVAVNYLGGYRNTMTLVLTGLDIEAKARVAEESLWARIPRDSFDAVDVTLTDSGLLRITVMDADQHKAGRAFSSAVVETGLASYPGFYGLTPPGNASPYGVYWPVLVPASQVHPQVFLSGKELPSAAAMAAPQATAPISEPSSPHAPAVPATPNAPTASGTPATPSRPAASEVRRSSAPVDGGRAPDHDTEETVRIPLGRIAGARSGDKGGNANLGVWADTAARYAWLQAHLTPARLAELLPSLSAHRIDRHELPNIKALNFVIHGLLGRGVAASPRMDPQAKALGEELRAQLVDVPTPLT
ncbi:acyclic terpene utilization AtuA family protein [Nonomuraea basaltis]|uniref:acyclic terpene utilization AtuA family protein n=1 Tax=Nonomuraea basaltis TaxID=2495887 RepID=UPI00110C6015|nr:acyclic terpene utilization AtuA family protein [Nonomuraea basaltis]TMR92427.1 acyclic terpene utilization AtuA family protein [Nonomuraea basaltis]